MLKKTTLTLLALILLMTISVSSSHAISMTLDGVANAVLWSQDKNKPYLNVWDHNSSSYYYQWKYDGSTSLQWNNMNELVTDLNNQGVNWWLESGGDPFNSPASTIWKSVSLSQGTYEISLADNSAAYNLVDYWGLDMWNAYVQIWTEYGDSFNFGNGFPSFNSENNALSYYRSSVDGITLNLQKETEVFFYINDNNSIDNSGSVTLDITSTAVPEPSTFVLLAFGMILFFTWQHKQTRHRAAL